MIWEAFGLSLLINGALFLIAYRWQTDKLTDFSYSFAFIVLVLVGYVAATKGFIQVIALAMILVWAARLGGFLVWRIRRMGRDKRFDGRRDLRKFGSFWLAQAITVPVLLLPVLWLFSGQSRGLGVMSVVGLVIWALGLIVETLADVQKSRFNFGHKKPQAWIDEGLWHYSRHPNYLGEITVWVGVYVLCFSHITASQKVVALLSPVLIFVLLRFVSGAPLLEKGADERWGKDPAYKSYKVRTGLILPKL